MLLLLTLFLAPFLICMLGLGLPVRPCKAPVLTMGTAIYRSLHTPEPRNPKKVSKRSSRASPPGVPKKCRKSPRTLIFDTFLTRFRVFWDFFDTFLTLRAGRPGRTVLRLFSRFRGSRVWRLLYMAVQSKFPRMFSCKQGQTSGSNITKKMFWWKLLL